MQMDPSKPYVMFFDELLGQRGDDIYIPPPNSMFAMNEEKRIMIFMIPLDIDPKKLTPAAVSELVKESILNSKAT